MNVWVTGVVLLLAAVAAIAVIVHLVRDETATDRTFVLLGLVEVALAVQLVVGLVLLAGTDRDVHAVTFVSYLVCLLLAVPVGAFWSLAERSRAGTAVLLLALLTVAGLELRLDTIWSGGA